MKKFSLSTTLKGLLVVFALTAFAACQKEQSPSANSASTATGSESMQVGVAGAGNFAGSIQPSYASALASNYARVYGSSKSQTQYVAFSAKDLESFIHNLRTKYGSDVILVNFGVYGQGANAVNSKDNGRLTVFFTGNNLPGSSAGGRRNDGVSDGGGPDEFLNHGELVP